MESGLHNNSSYNGSNNNQGGRMKICTKHLNLWNYSMNCSVIQYFNTLVNLSFWKDKNQMSRWYI